MTIPPGSRLPTPLQFARSFRDPVGTLRRYRDRYGPIFRMRFPGAPWLVYVGDPAMAHRIFATDRDIGRAGAARRDFLEPLVGSHSLLTLDGEEWVRQRKRHGSAFHGRRVQAYREQMAEIAARRVAKWPVGRSVAVRPFMQEITLDIIIQVVFGITDTPRVDRLQALIPKLMTGAESMEMLLLLLPEAVRGRAEGLLARLPGGAVARYRMLKSATDSILYDEIARRRSAEDVGEDVLAGLLDDDVGDEELRDALMTLLLAGHETTATALAWCFERLARHPAAQERLRDGDPDYLDAVIKETLRTRPVVMDMPRILAEPMELGGYHIPAGWMISPAAPLIHDSATAFPEPAEFRPERFLADDVPAQSWIPFGGGRRQCLGAQFAMAEMAAVIPEIIRRFRVEPPNGTRDERQAVRHVTVGPAKDAQVTLSAIP